MREQMDLTERKLGREDKFTGRIVSVHVDTVELPDGETASREVVAAGSARRRTAPRSGASPGLRSASPAGRCGSRPG
ncbi:MAG: ADP-ribose pyrophosphatase, partial [Oscillibacter sp.]|nr:ADP-ribose pyrophosphatase [Oscillibacter sp.]